jgi:hypothetical protein
MATVEAADKPPSSSFAADLEICRNAKAKTLAPARQRLIAVFGQRSTIPIQAFHNITLRVLKNTEGRRPGSGKRPGEN